MLTENIIQEPMDTFSINNKNKEDFKRSKIIKQKKSFRDLFKRKKNEKEKGPRIIHINNEELNKQQKFMSNSVSTAKYNLVTFLPKFLFEEFSKSANVFFLFISGIQVSLFLISFGFFLY
jgi:hypothetical protein